MRRWSPVRGRCGKGHAHWLLICKGCHNETIKIASCHIQTYVDNRDHDQHEFIMNQQNETQLELIVYVSRSRNINNNFILEVNNIADTHTLNYSKVCN